MKKTLAIAFLCLAMGTALISGTMAVYNIELGKIAEGSVTAKAFSITGEGDEFFSTDVKIAPSETVKKRFTVSNFENSVISETPMKTTIAVDLLATDSKTAIPYLNVDVFKIDGDKSIKIGETITNGTGTITFEDGYPLSTQGTTYTYEVVIDWPDTNGQTDSNQDGISDDATYANSNYSNTVQVHVTGTQVKDAEPYVIK